MNSQMRGYMRQFWKRIPKESDSDKEEQLKQEPLEKKDLPALLLASLISVFLPVLLILLFFCGLCYILFVGF